MISKSKIISAIARFLTEPLIRCYFEAQSVAEVEKLKVAAQQFIREAIQ